MLCKCLIFLLVLKQGLELDDFVSGPRELLLKFVEENYPLPPKPESLPGMDGLHIRLSLHDIPFPAYLYSI